ncbi:Gp64 [Mycolicibacterium canariasense]|uniref:Gp64 n=1 Tax=Mycolicibacterium canariasense TaxID=228230 RepID=A0A100WC91_MYCCR|nr:hypothetical protein AWB94_00830 [Mycolicibacterium canariasense]GAS95481.1 Gp64 [Mycolicibacterium canariasense]
MRPGDDVTVMYEGPEHAGVVVRSDHGWVLCRIAIDPVWDYGAVSARLVPHSLVMVREDNVKALQPRENA